MNAPEQAKLDVSELTVTIEPSRMVARVSALAIKRVFPFIGKDDIRFYLNGANIRPLDDGSVMVVATDGHRFVVVRDPNGFAEQEVIVSVQKDGLKHAGNPKNTFDVMSNGAAMILDEHALQLFVQPGRSVIEGDFPRIENVASTIGYTEGIHGAVNPAYLADALAIGEQFGSIRFFSRSDLDSPLCFVCGGIGELECFGGITRMRDSFEALPRWFPMRTEPNSLAEV